MNFTVLLKAEDSSIWEGGIYPFKVTVPENFPIEPPVVKLPEAIFHPNIDMDGNVCLNILRKDWAPVITINHIIFGLETLLNDPNPNDPLNRYAAQLQVNDFKQFKETVKMTLKGGKAIHGEDHGGVKYTKFKRFI